MTNDDVLYRSRLRLFALAREMGSVRAACRLMGVHHSTYYRWQRQLVRYGTEILRPRERRQPRMPNAISPMFEQRILSLALAYPGWGPDRLSLELGRPKWGGLKVSANGVWRVLKRHGLSTRAKRLGLVAGYAAPPEPEPRPPLPEMHIKADRPGHRVQMDCFYIGRLSGTQGVVWQYTAIDVASSFTWAELHLTPKNPSAKWTSEPARIDILCGSVSAHLDSGHDRSVVKLSEAARRLGYNVETLRLRVRSGEIVAKRGAHGAFFISEAQLAQLRPPIRSVARTFDPDAFELTWRLVEDVSPEFDVGEIARLLGMVRRDPSSNRELYNLLSVARLRRAGLTTAEVARHVGISSRHVRRLTAMDLDEEVERLAKRQQARERAEAMRKAMAVVIELENRVHAAGLQEHAMRARGNQPLRSTGRPRPAIRVRELDRAMRANLRHAGLTREQLEAIAVAGMSIDVLNELLLNGLPNDDPK